MVMLELNTKIVSEDNLKHEVVSRYRDLQLQEGENCSYLLNLREHLQIDVQTLIFFPRTVI